MPAVAALLASKRGNKPSASSPPKRGKPPNGKVDYSTQVANADGDGAESSGSAGRTGNMKRTNTVMMKTSPSRTSSLKDERLLRDLDTDKMKAALYENLGEREYDVSDFYKKEGIAQLIARNETFGHFTLFVISFNAIWIGIDTDRNPHQVLSQANVEFQVMEHFFCIFFSFEWTVRFLSFENKINCLRDNWFKFDTILAVLVVLETWLLPVVMGGGEGEGMGDASILRLLRLLRLTRMARIMRAFPELVTLLKGMAVATRSVFSTLTLLVLFLYTFAIIFKQQSDGNDVLEEFFGTIPMAMWSLLLSGTLLDNITNTLNSIQKEKWLLAAIFLLFVLISSFTVLNMLIGVLCEVVSAVAAAEKEETVVRFVKHQLLGVLMEVDTEGQGMISQEQFKEFVHHPQAASSFQELGVDTENLLSLVDILFAAEEDLRIHAHHAKSDVSCVVEMPNPDSNAEKNSSSPYHHHAETLPRVSAFLDPPPIVKLSFAEIIEIILDLRSSNTAMVKDVVELRKVIRKNQDHVMECLENLERNHETMFEEVSTRQDQLAVKQDEVLSIVKSLACSVQRLEDRMDGKSPQPKSCMPVTKPPVDLFSEHFDPTPPEQCNDNYLPNCVLREAEQCLASK